MQFSWRYFAFSFSFVDFVGSVAFSGSIAGPFASSFSVADFGVGSRVGILSEFFIGNNMLLKLLRTFPVALTNNTKLFKNTFFGNIFVPFAEIL